MPDTRIILRHDTSQNWAGASATNVAKGELAVQIDEQTIGSTLIRSAQAYLGVNPSGDNVLNCVYLGGGAVYETQGAAGPEITATTPVVYEDIASKSDGTTVRWDATNSKWVADAEVLTLDAYPTADGTVVYDADAGKFTVGAVVAATEIDGGTFS